MSSIVTALTGGTPQGTVSRPDLITPASKEQADQQYGNVNQGLNNQQNFLNAVQAQNGLGNQTSVFNQQQAIANGTGPNPAQAMLANSTGANVANQAALMAGQRGSGANAGMIARQAANAGAGIQQNAAGQAAALQSQQQLNATNQMGNIANQQVGQQANATNAYTQSALGAQSNVLGAIQGQNNASVGLNSANAALQGQINQGSMQLVGNLAGSAGAAMGMIPKAEGGLITKMAEGGPVSAVGRHFAGSPKIPLKPLMAEGGTVQAIVSPGEKYLAPKDVQKVAKGADPMKVGETIPGKPKVGGAKNDYANDTVPKTLEEGGIVLPRSVTQAKNPHWAAHAFVSNIMKKQAMGGKK